MFGHTKQFKQLTEEKKEEKPPIKPLLEDLQFISDCYRAFFKVGVNDSWKVVFREFFKQVKFHFGDRRFLVGHSNLGPCLIVAWGLSMILSRRFLV